MCRSYTEQTVARMRIKSAYERHFFKHRAKRKQRINMYPLLGIVLVILAAVLAYGAMYFLLSA